MEPEPVTVDESVEADGAIALAPEPTVVPEPAAAATASPRAAAPTRLPASVRAIQQQGVRKRRELDVEALGERDTRYALHELRRIAILTAMVVATLIVLGVVMR